MAGPSSTATAKKPGKLKVLEEPRAVTVENNPPLPSVTIMGEPPAAAVRSELTDVSDAQQLAALDQRAFHSRDGAQRVAGGSAGGGVDGAETEGAAPTSAAEEMSADGAALVKVVRGFHTTASPLFARQATHHPSTPTVPSLLSPRPSTTKAHAACVPRTTVARPSTSADVTCDVGPSHASFTPLSPMEPWGKAGGGPATCAAPRRSSLLPSNGLAPPSPPEPPLAPRAPHNLYAVRVLTKTQRVKRSFPAKRKCDFCSETFYTKKERAQHYSGKHSSD